MSMRNRTNVLIVVAVTFLVLACPLGFKAHAAGGDKVVDVKILSIKGCAATPPTIDLVKSVAEELKIKIKLTNVFVETPKEAKKERFLGSPTVQINDLDIEPDSRNLKNFGVT